MSCEVIRSVQQMKLIAKSYQASTSVGFIPTMGALHQGHLKLVKESLRHNDVTVVSIFVNPTQFNNPQDFAKYPHSVNEDIEKLSSAGVDFVFLPEESTIYPNGFQYKVTENNWSLGLCGDARPGHFDGVLTVLIKLFNLVKPTKIYMGLKDYQQWKLVKGMCEDFFMDIDVVGVPTERTAEGLALSSRNLNLKSEDMSTAYQFAQILKQNKNLTEIRRELEQLDLKIDYLEERWGRRFAAVFIGDVRLIDNIGLNEEAPSVQYLI